MLKPRVKATKEAADNEAVKLMKSNQKKFKLFSN
jgi:hypothetical protein